MDEERAEQLVMEYEQYLFRRHMQILNVLLSATDMDTAEKLLKNLEEASARVLEACLAREILQSSPDAVADRLQESVHRNYSVVHQWLTEHPESP